MKKYKFPDGTMLYIQHSVLKTFKKYKQDKFQFESGGFLAGYVNCNTESTIIDKATVPQPKDESGRNFFHLKDETHSILIDELSKDKSYFLGTWHTHPCNRAAYSKKDLKDWNKSMKIEIPASKYYIFIIVAIEEIGVWAGNMENYKITKLKEMDIRYEE